MKFGKLLLRLLFILATILLIIAVFRITYNPVSNNVPSLTNLLDYLTTINPVDIGFINDSVIVLGDWGIFNFLRDFVSFFIQIINVIIFIFNGLINIVLYAYSVLRWIFLA